MLNCGESEGLRPRPAPRRREHLTEGPAIVQYLADSKPRAGSLRQRALSIVTGCKSGSPSSAPNCTELFPAVQQGFVGRRPARRPGIDVSPELSVQRRSRARWPHLYKRITAGGMRGLSVIRSARPHAISVARTRGDMLAVFEIEGSRSRYLSEIAQRRYVRTFVKFRLLWHGH